MRQPISLTDDDLFALSLCNLYHWALNAGHLRHPSSPVSFLSKRT